MSRDLQSSITTALDGEVVQPYMAVDLAFDGGNLRLWTGVGDLTISSNTYTGAGNLLSISNIEETAEIAAKGATLVLSGIPSSILSDALTEAYQGRLCTIYFGIVGGDSSEVFQGFMDQMIIDEGPETCTVTLTVENRLVDLERPRVLRFTDQSQQARLSGLGVTTDKGLQFVDSLQNKVVAWGKTSE